MVPSSSLRRRRRGSALLVHDQVEREIFDEKLGVVLERLPVERVQHGVAGTVGGGAGALRWRPLAVMGGHAAEGPLVDRPSSVRENGTPQCSSS